MNKIQLMPVVVKTMYDSGMTQIEIASKLGVSKTKIHLFMRNHGIKARPAVKRDPSGENSNAWKGNKTTYRGLHNRVEASRGKPSKCDKCGTDDPKKVYQWASLNKKHNDVNDYARMCRSCHSKFDGVINNIKHMKKRRMSVVKPKYISLFTGIGGFDLGLDSAGFECALQVENDKFCREVLDRHWPDVPKMEDVKNVTKETFHGPVDVIVGGFPCTDVSIAGGRQGLDGENSKLWFEFHRILKEFKPGLFVIENVPGLFSSNRGLDFGRILRGLDELGYYVAWRVLDSQHFGVPQRRRRVFIVGSLGNGSCGEILFERESLCRYTAKSRKTRPGNSGGIKGCLNPASPQADRVRTVDGQSSTLVGHGGGMGAKTGLYMVPETCGTWTSRFYRGLSGQDAYSDHLIPTNKTLRRLKPTECCRLQGFPDDWNDWLSDAQRYKQMGNAVTVNVAQWIAKRLLEVLNGN